MKKHYQAIKLSLLAASIIVLLTACGGNETKPEAPATLPETANPASSFLNGKLDTLWVSSANFKALPKNKDLLLSYFFNRSDSSLILHGWTQDKKLNGKRTFDTIPTLMLAKGRASTQDFSANLYFNNVLLEKDAVEAIKTELTNQRYAFVLFAPEIAFKTKYGAEIKYAILFSNDDPSKLAGGKSVPAAAGILYANPSPPKEN